MKRSRIDYSTIFSPATVLKSTGTSVAGTLPLDTAGLRAMVVRVTATAAGYVRMSTSANPVSASSGDTLVQPGDFLLMRTAGMDYVSFVSESGTATCTVSPQEFGGYVTGSVVVQFSPAMLFTGTTVGTWYDPSDITTLYQNAAGTTPVTAVEQPVGLMLDKSKGLVLGPELVTNGDFSNGTTGWTAGPNNTISVVSGQLKCVSSQADGAYFGQSFAVDSGKTYKFVYQAVSDGTSQAPGAALGTSLGSENRSGVVADGGYAFGSRTFVYRASATETIWLWFYAGSSKGVGNYILIDNISVRELPGNHAFNSSGNSANFPVLSARYNLLTKSEQFEDGVWYKGNTTISATKVTAPDGTLTGRQLLETTANAAHYIDVASSITVSSGVTYKRSIRAKYLGRQWIVAQIYDTSAGYAWFDIQNGVVGTVMAGVTATIEPLADGWYNCTVSRTVTGASIYIGVQTAIADNSTATFVGDTSKGIQIWGADLRAASDALNQPVYQRVNTSTDYDTSGFKPYLRFNGTNQWLQTNSIDFTYGDKMFVSAGVRKLSDAVRYTPVVELSTNAGQNNGAFQIMAPDEPNTYYFRSRGTSTANASSSQTFASPITNVISGIGNISGDQAILRVNGTQAAISIADQGTGNYGNYQMFIGASAGSSLWFNGRLYGMVVAGKQASAAEITSTETYLNQKTGAF